MFRSFRLDIERTSHTILTRYGQSSCDWLHSSQVAVDYRPVMSTIIDDYLFRCPSWKLASQLTEQRASYFAQNTSASSTSNSTNVYVYRFSQPTHVAGYPECWGLACHTAEMPYIFNSIPIIMEEVRSCSGSQRQTPAFVNSNSFAYPLSTPCVA